MMSLADAIIYQTIAEVRDIVDNTEVELNDLDEYGFTPLIEAAIFKKNDIAEYLLEKGADPNFADSSGRTPLHWASDNRNPTLIKMLCKKRANPNAYTLSAQPVLAMPLLRGEDNIKNLLYDNGARLEFAQDYINGKLVSHRFELVGHVHLATPGQRFIMLDSEGFFLEFSLGIIRQSLSRYRSNFAAKHLRDYFNYIEYITQALIGAEELIHYQHYAFKVEENEKRIAQLLKPKVLIIPATYQGHAITFIRCGDLFVKCDRGANSDFEGTIVVYHLGNPRNATPDFLKEVIYTKQDDEFMHRGVNQYLGLKKLLVLPIPRQQTGNCSWANVEATIPALLYCLFSQGRYNAKHSQQYCQFAFDFYREWREWDKDRALNECIQALERAPLERAKTKAALLGMVLFQSCDPDNTKDLSRAQDILKVLTQTEYDFILRSYIKVYGNAQLCGGPRFMKLLRKSLPTPNRFIRE